MEHRPRARLTAVCIDGADADQLAAFYGHLLGLEVTADDGCGWVQLRHPDGGIGLNVQAEPWYRPPTWPETADTQHKMLHLEIEVTDLDATVELVVANGGAVAPHQPEDRNPTRLRVMLDPAGHPFCLFVAGE